MGMYLHNILEKANIEEQCRIGGWGWGEYKRKGLIIKTYRETFGHGKNIVYFYYSGSCLTNALFKYYRNKCFKKLGFTV